jgi:hypothetical protein
LGRAGMVWMSAYEGYCQLYGFNALTSLFHFLTADALTWWYHLATHAQTVNVPLTWPFVRTEFLRTYSPADRRTPAAQARQTFLSHGCTMNQHATVSQYENAFRVLVRECPDMSGPDQIAWFLAGLTPAYRRMCATRQDGTDWPDLPTLVTFALGCEAREIAATQTGTSPQPKKARFNSATFAAAADTQAPVLKKQRLNEQSPGVGSIPQLSIPREIPGGLRALWVATQANGFKDRCGKGYTPATFLELCQATPSRCVQCHKVRGAGAGECVGHVRPGGKARRGGRGKGKGKRNSS